MDTIDPILPFKWKHFDDVELMTMQYYEVIFLDDFGVFKKGEQVDTLVVYYDKGLMVAYDNNNPNDSSLQRTQSFKCVPCDEVTNGQQAIS